MAIDQSVRALIRPWREAANAGGLEKHEAVLRRIVGRLSRTVAASLMLHNDLRGWDEICNVTREPDCQIVLHEVSVHRRKHVRGRLLHDLSH